MLAALLFSAQSILAHQSVHQTEDVAAVATLLMEIERGSAELEDIRFEDLEVNDALSPQTFVSFATECPIERINTVPSSDIRQAIFVTWDCHDYRTEGRRELTDLRKAVFFFRGSQITRVKFGTPEVITVGAQKPAPGRAEH